MLVLRKEIKIGIGAGLAILGIAGVYGLMASLSGNGEKSDQSALVTSDDDAARRKKALEDAVAGPVPVENETQPTVLSPVKPAVPAVSSNILAESKRTDGNANNEDVWSSALSGARFGDVTNAARETGGATVIASPTPETVKPVRTDAFAPSEPTLTPAPTRRVDAAKPAHGDTAPAVAGGTYTVKAGDTFSTISNNVYGTKKHYAALAKANPDVNPSRMKIGQKIVVPPKEQVASVGGSVRPDAPTLAAPIDATRQYRVAAGDTLSHIAGKLYGKQSQWQAIYEANKTLIGPDEARLKLGTVLKLPSPPVR